MLPRRKIYLTLILLGLFLGPGHAQTESVSGIINHYAAIESILAWETNNVDSLLVNGLDPAFKDGDTVMVYYVRGIVIDNNGGIVESRYAGKYAFLIITEIIKGPVDTIVVLNAALTPEIGRIRSGDVAQLIRVPSYRNAEVIGEVTAPPWNGSTGGVVSMFVTNVLKLGADINVSGLGFRGGVEDVDYQGVCSFEDPGSYSSLYYPPSPVLAGRKGEGITETLFTLMRGKGYNINGGGGGNGKLSGGGGGANYSVGGKGGNELDDCDPGLPDLGGNGGYGLFSPGYYLNSNELDPVFNRFNRVFFGGGGGVGVRVPGYTGSSGARGGGLVVIVADTIDGNGSGWIRANGASVTGTVTGSGGGGGGGGAIILDVSGYKNNPRLSATGGKGGDTNGAAPTGPGGGGGGGIYWLSGTGDRGLNVVDDVKGQPGRHLGTSSYFGAQEGGFANWKDGLEAPLRGFLFNSVPSEFWVCSDQVPDDIIASEPKGGSGTYSYQWVDSSSSQNSWQPLPGATGRSLSFSAPLADTTYFRRIVTDPKVAKPDISFRIAVYVHQAITNNTISAPDTVCQGNIPVPFVSVGSPGAGIGTYKYRWQKDEGSGIYSPANGTNTQPGYVPPAGLNGSTHFARITTSGACVDTSAALRVTVFAPISNNILADYDTICVNTAPERIIQDPEFTLSGGDPDPTNWRYRWQSGPSITGPWAGVAGANASAYQPGNLTATIWYRREVLSGNGDACVDFSPPVEILNVPIITNNLITTADQTVCTGDQPELMQGSVPGGGHPAQIYYKWESSTAGSGWVEADDTNGNNLQSYTPPVMTGDTTFYRRVVSSGGQEGVCKNTSAAKTIQVIPAISGNMILTDVTVNCQFDFLAGLTQNPASGPEPGGGATQGGSDPTRNYRWELATGTVAPGPWSQVSYGPAELNYTDHPQLSLSEDYWYRRVVLSGPSLGGQDQVCSQVSDTIHIVIHTAISGNEIDPADSACLNTEKVLHGEMPTGEGEEATLYSWRDFATGAEMGTGKDLPYTFTTLDSREFNRIVVIGECEDTSGNMSVTMMELPGGTLAGDLPKACEKDILLDVDLNIEDLVQYLTPWEISLSDGVHTELLDPQLLDGDGTVEVNLSTDALSTQYHYTIGKLLYRLTDGTECIAPAQNLVGNVPIEVFMTPDPVITVTTGLTDSSVCDNEVSLVVDPDHGTGSWASDFPGKLGFLPDPLALSVRASIDPADPEAWAHLPYTLYFTSEAGDCSGTDTVKISFFEQPEPPYAGEDDTIYLTNTIKLNADPPTAGVGTWTVTVGSGDFEDEHDPKTLVYGLVKGERNEFKWEIVNGVCVFDDDFTVITQDEAQPYEGISPNGDQVNDYFIIRGLAEATEFSISIFNALGNSVRTITRENIGEIDYDAEVIQGGLREDEMVVWDGKANNGNLVPAGTYYYVLNVKIDQKDGSTDKLEKKHYIIVRD